MFPKRTPSRTEAFLDKEVVKSLAQLHQHQPDSAEYGKIVERVSTLHKMKAEERPFTKVSTDTILVVIANIVGILILTRYERENVITSKALGFVKRV